MIINIINGIKLVSLKIYDCFETKYTAFLVETGRSRPFLVPPTFEHYLHARNFAL